MKEIKTILIIGAGFMGTGIAQVCAEAGYDVFINDISSALIEKSISSIKERWETKVNKGKIEKNVAQDYAKHLGLQVELNSSISKADLIIEAASENLEMKKKIFERINQFVSDSAIIASNTSSISITKLAGNIDKQGRFIGTHFFSPVPVMKLLEIIPGLATDCETIESIKEFGKTIGKITIQSKDSVGFVVNRLVDPMMNEAIRMLNDGVAGVEDIDNGAKYGLNHPIGPLELADMVGIDVLCSVMDVMYEQTANSSFAPAPLLTKMVEAGFVGKKVGKGFYIYNEDGSAIVNPIFK